MQLERWEARRDYDRLGLSEERYHILNLPLPLIRMPVAPGRNLAILVEIAARNQLLRGRGHHAARKLADRLEHQLQLAGLDEHRRVGDRRPARHRRRAVTRGCARPATAVHRRARARRRTQARFIVLTGLSGSGKSQAIRALEDLGYFCVDNIPTTLIPTLAELVRREGISRVAIVVDIREKNFLAEFPKTYRKLRSMKGLNPALIFLEATHATLVRRFSETRRPHPLAPDSSASEGIKTERRRMNSIRSMADHIIDTSDLTVHQLRQAFKTFAFSVGRRRKGRAAGSRSRW